MGYHHPCWLFYLTRASQSSTGLSSSLMFCLLISGISYRFPASLSHFPPNLFHGHSPTHTGASVDDKGSRTCLCIRRGPTSHELLCVCCYRRTPRLGWMRLSNLSTVVPIFIIRLYTHTFHSLLLQGMVVVNKLLSPCWPLPGTVPACSPLWLDYKANIHLRASCGHEVTQINPTQVESPQLLSFLSICSRC